MTRKIPEENARQGRLGLPVLIVLGVSLLLAAVYLLGTGLWVQTSNELAQEPSAIERQSKDIEG